MDTLAENGNLDVLAFEHIKKIDFNGNEYWSARELQKLLDYSQWRRFEETIQRAIKACETAGNVVADNFAEVGKTVELTMGTREINDYRLSRYACYLIVQNGDSRKPAIALGQSYFAIKTREQELSESFNELTENQKRIAIRDELTRHNRSLAEAAKNAGVIDYPKFQNHGYMGLYDGMTANDIHAHKGLSKGQAILDYMGSTELAANLFRATQTDEKLRRENIKGEDIANKTHYDVGKKVRQTMLELGNKAPEDLPIPSEGIKDLKKKIKSDKNSHEQLNLF